MLERIPKPFFTVWSVFTGNNFRFGKLYYYNKSKLTTWNQTEKVYIKVFSPGKAVEWPDNYFNCTTSLWYDTYYLYASKTQNKIHNKSDFNIIECNCGNQIISGEFLI